MAYSLTFDFDYIESQLRLSKHWVRIRESAFEPYPQNEPLLVTLDNSTTSFSWDTARDVDIYCPPGVTLSNAHTFDGGRNVRMIGGLATNTLTFTDFQNLWVQGVENTMAAASENDHGFVLTPRDTLTDNTVVFSEVRVIDCWGTGACVQIAPNSNSGLAKVVFDQCHFGAGYRVVEPDTDLSSGKFVSDIIFYNCVFYPYNHTTPGNDQDMVIWPEDYIGSSTDVRLRFINCALIDILNTLGYDEIVGPTSGTYQSKVAGSQIGFFTPALSDFEVSGVIDILASRTLVAAGLGNAYTSYIGKESRFKTPGFTPTYGDGLTEPNENNRWSYAARPADIWAWREANPLVAIPSIPVEPPPIGNETGAAPDGNLEIVTLPDDYPNGKSFLSSPWPSNVDVIYHVKHGETYTKYIDHKGGRNVRTIGGKMTAKWRYYDVYNSVYEAGTHRVISVDNEDAMWGQSTTGAFPRLYFQNVVSNIRSGDPASFHSDCWQWASASNSKYGDIIYANVEARSGYQTVILFGLGSTAQAKQVLSMRFANLNDPDGGRKLQAALNVYTTNTGHTLEGLYISDMVTTELGGKSLSNLTFPPSSAPTSRQRTESSGATYKWYSATTGNSITFGPKTLYFHYDIYGNVFGAGVRDEDANGEYLAEAKSFALAAGELSVSSTDEDAPGAYFKHAFAYGDRKK